MNQQSAFHQFDSMPLARLCISISSLVLRLYGFFSLLHFLLILNGKILVFICLLWLIGFYSTCVIIKIIHIFILNKKLSLCTSNQIENHLVIKLQQITSKFVQPVHPYDELMQMITEWLLIWLILFFLSWLLDNDNDYEGLLSWH